MSAHAASSGCQVVYTVTSQWPGGFGASAAVTNLGDPVTGWTLTWSFPPPTTTSAPGSGGALISPHSDATHSLVAVEDPSIVYDNGRLYRSQSSLADFPNGHRYFRSYTSNSLTGAWTPYTAGESAWACSPRSAPPAETPRRMLGASLGAIMDGGTVEKPAGGLGAARLTWRWRSAGRFRARGFIPGVTAEADEYGALRDLVAEVAHGVGVPVPRTVFGGECCATIAGDRAAGFSLRVDPCLVVGLAAGDLRIVLAHAMAVLREPRPDLAATLYRTYTLMSEGFAGRRWLNRNRRFWTDIERRADQAARSAAQSGTEAATALTRAGALGWHFAWYQSRYLTVAPERQHLQDMLADWLDTLARPVPSWAAHSPVLSGLGPKSPPHPGFGPVAYSAAKTLRAAGGLAPEPGTAIVERIAPADVLGLNSQFEPDFDSTPEYDYARAEQDILRGASSLAGRSATAEDVLRLFELDRGADLARAWYDASRQSAGYVMPGRQLALARGGADSTPTPGELLEALVAAQAIRRGLRYDSILRPGLLTAADRPDVDLYAVIDRALRDGAVDLAELRPLL